MEGTQKEKELNLLTDVAYCFINGLLLFAISYPLFLGLTMINQAIRFFDISLLSNVLILVILALVPVSLIIGVVNTITARYLWSFRCKSNGRMWMTHGFLIVVITLLLLIPLPTVQTILTGVPLWVQPFFVVLTYIDYWILFGFMGRIIARRYIEPQPYRQRIVTEAKSLPFAGTRARCPRCNASFRYRDDEIASDGTVKCITCNRSFYIESISVLMGKIGENIDTNSRIDL